MKKLYPLFLFLICFIASSSTLQAQAIVNYYNLLADYDDDVKLHTLSEENGAWYATNHKSEKVKIHIDKKNNFLEIKDKERGGIFTLQVSLFKKSNGETLIGLVKNHMDIFLHGEIHILKLRNGRWNDITSEVMPELTYKDFVENTMSLAASAFNPQLNHHLEFGYQLPREGSIASAQMQTQVLKDKCAQNDPNVSDYCAALHEISYSTIELKWDGDKDKFVLGDKR
jgi:hypothetical protein